MPYSRKGVISARIKELSDDAGSDGLPALGALDEPNINQIALHNEGRGLGISSIRTRLTIDRASSSAFSGTTPLAQENQDKDLDFLCEGSAADVYLTSSRKVIKIMRIVPGYFRNTGDSKDEESLSKLLKAFRVAALTWRLLRHKRIVEVGNFEASPHRITISQEYCEHGDLRQYLKRGIPIRIRVVFMLDILEGLVYLHSLDPPIVHGCINTEKIYVTSSGTPKLGEFSLSQLVTGFPNLVPSIHTGGIARWMSPEYFDESCPGARTCQLDIWSFGCTSFEVITGLLPYYQCKNDAQVLMKLKDYKLPGRMNFRILPRDDVGTLSITNYEDLGAPKRGSGDATYPPSDPIIDPFKTSKGEFTRPWSHSIHGSTIGSEPSSNQELTFGRDRGILGAFIVSRESYRDEILHAGVAWELIQKCWLLYKARPSAKILLSSVNYNKYRRSFTGPPSPMHQASEKYARIMALIQFMFSGSIANMRTGQLLEYITSNNICKNLASSPGFVYISEESASDTIVYSKGSFFRVVCDGMQATLHIPICGPDPNMHLIRLLCTWSQCDHPYILKLIGVAPVNDRLALIFPKGLNPLCDRLDSLNLEERYEMCAKIADGVAYLHDLKFVLGGLGVSNILILQDLTPVIAGLQYLTPEDLTPLFYYTGIGPLFPGICPPLKDAELTFQADVCALGETLLEVITGVRLEPSRSIFGGLSKGLQYTRWDISAYRSKFIEQFRVGDKRKDYTWSLLESCWSPDLFERPRAANVRDEIRRIWVSEIQRHSNLKGSRLQRRPLK